jgi:hypothetical protein
MQLNVYFIHSEYMLLCFFTHTDIFPRSVCDHVSYNAGQLMVWLSQSYAQKKVHIWKVANDLNSNKLALLVSLPFSVCTGCLD